jgi:hypothetical protein
VIYVTWIMPDQIQGSVIEPFSVGYRLTWPLVSPRGYEEYLAPYMGDDEVSRITHAVDGYFYFGSGVTGTVLTIKKLYGEQAVHGNGVPGRPTPGSGRFFSDTEAVQWEEEKEGLEFIGYLVELDASEQDKPANTNALGQR